MVLGYRLIDIRSFWRPNIRIVKIAIRFSTRLDVYAVAERATPVLLNDLLVHASYKMLRIKPHEF